MTAAAPRRHLEVALAVAFSSGFIALSYELAWYRVYSFYTWSSAATFGVLLAAYLFGVAFGSFGSRRFCRDRTTVGEARELFPLAGFFLAANLLSFLVAPLVARAFTATDSVAPLLLVTLAAGVMGAVLPLTAHFAIAPDAHAGQRLSWLYVANIAGSTLGSLLTGFVFFDTMSLASTSLVLGVLGCVAAAALFASSGGIGGVSPKRVLAGVGTSTVAALVVIAFGHALYDGLWERLFYKREYAPTLRFAEVVENKHGVIAVTRDLTVLGGGAYDGRISTSLVHDRNGLTRAFAVGALHPRPRRILMVGLATGAWAQVLVNHPDVERVTAVEINPGYLDIISKHPEVSGLLKNPKFTVAVDDGRRWLRRHPDEKFDLVVMNTTWSWRAHITNLLSVEYMQLAREHLAPGGIFFFNTTSSPEAMKTGLSSFPYGMRVHNFLAVSNDPFTLDKARWTTLLAEWRIEGKLVVEPGGPDFVRLAGYADTLDAPPIKEGLERGEHLLPTLAGARIITDDNMVTEFRVPLRQPDPM